QGTRCALTPPAAIHQLFERQAREAPHAVAVTWPGGQWSYAELDRRANRLAHRLRALGVGPGTWVATLLDRSAAMVEALLGILKAGGAYVPLERRLPAARMVSILDTLGVSVVVTEDPHGERLRRLELQHGRLEHLVCLDHPDHPEQPWDAARRTGAAPLACRTGPQDVAYAIFTSGSTGIPKGVVVRHQAVVNLIAWLNETFAVGPADRLLFVTSLAFDLSVYDVFGILAAGGSIRVATDVELAEPASLAAVLLAEPITCWDSAPVALAQLAPWLPPAPAPGSVLASNRGHCPALRLVLLSGDWVPLTLPSRLRESFPGCRVVALGGATEATVWSNFFPVSGVDPRWVSIPYGRPIRNARYLVLDTLLRPCPIGAAGDLHIGGDCLASGYAGAPALTAASFVPDPFAHFADGGARLYRTGDRARTWPDGTIEFLGRLDQQVKIRGFRIETGEIEAVLLRHPAVREAVAAVREDATGENCLVAWVVPRGELADPVLELRPWLAASLPDYMLPAAIVPLAALPLTANGKLDRRALPAPGHAAAAAASLARRAHDPVEELLGGLWCQVLGVERADPQGNFFDLGGHSLRATQLISRIRAALGVELPLRGLFEAPTLRQLAVAVTAALEQGTRVPPVARATRPTAGTAGTAGSAGADPVEAPASYSQQRLWLLEQLAAGNPAYVIAAALELAGELEVAALAAALREVVRRQESLRTTFAAREGTAIQLIGPPWQPRLPRIDLRGLDPARREACARSLLDAQLGRPFDLGGGPLLRTALLRLAPARHLLAVSMHHIVSDAWSLGVLVEEMAHLYTAASTRQPAPPAPRYQYADYAAWQRQWLCGEALA
ncbi:MAG TPA: amino acid adenylation domain-containing protein, partial [Thermoanaerobaculia bacterium]